MGLSLAGIPLFLPDLSDPGLAEALRLLDPRDARPSPRRSWPGAGLEGIAFPTGFDPGPPVRINRMTWPWGAGRWAEGWFLCSGDAADAIRDEAFGEDGLGSDAIDLAMDSPGLASAGESLAVSVYLALPPIPIVRVPDDSGGFGAGADDGSSGVYLLSLVDARFYWWDLACPKFSPAIDGVSVQWTDLWTQISALLGVTIAVDAVDAAYRLPNPSLQLPDRPLPVVMDAIAANCGQRILFDYDGSIRTVNPATALSLRQADDAGFKMRNLVGGGDWFLDSL